MELMRHRTNIVYTRPLKNIIKIRIGFQEIIRKMTFEINQEETNRIDQSLTRN